MEIPIGYGQITHVFQGAAVPRGAVITYGIRNDLDKSAALVAAGAANAFDTSNLDAMMSSNCDMVLTRAKLGPKSNGDMADQTLQVGGAGTASGGAAVSLLFTKVTGVGGRRGRGRFYLPGVPEANVDEGGRITSGTHTTAQAAATALLTALEAADIPMVLLHSNEVTTPFVVTSLQPSVFVATQRRRQPRSLY